MDRGLECDPPFTFVGAARRARNLMLRRWVTMHSYLLAGRIVPKQFVINLLVVTALLPYLYLCSQTIEEVNKVN